MFVSRYTIGNPHAVSSPTSTKQKTTNWYPLHYQNSQEDEMWVLPHSTFSSGWYDHSADNNKYPMYNDRGDDATSMTSVMTMDTSVLRISEQLSFIEETETRQDFTPPVIHVTGLEQIEQDQGENGPSTPISRGRTPRRANNSNALQSKKRKVFGNVSNTAPVLRPPSRGVPMRRSLFL